MSTSAPSALRRPAPGTPGAAWSHQPFRWIFVGTFTSNIGTWMQNVALLAFADALTHSAAFVGLVTFAQLGPMLFLSPFGGALADLIDRKVLMISAALVQGSMSLALAWASSVSHPSRALIIGSVFGIGLASAINGPAAQAILPALVGREDLAGAISLNSAQMNASRVLGPLLAVLPFLTTPWIVFSVNAATYLFVVVALLVVSFDSRPVRGVHRESVRRHLAGGLRSARANPVVGRSLTVVALFSLCSLVFIYQMPGFARTALGFMRTADGAGHGHLVFDESMYRLLFATFGLGAASGAIAVGTRLRLVDPTRLTRWSLASFAAALCGFALSTGAATAFPTVFVTGFSYFVVITVLATMVQAEVDDMSRGRVMALWMMAWAGLVPVGSLIAGEIIGDSPDAGAFRVVLVFGAAVAAGLIVPANLRHTNGGRVDPAPQPDSP
ncbi:MAG: MFS transporter [Microthrixaceae bacterium]